LNAAGTLGFAQEGQSLISLGELGAFITNPISAHPRSPARDSGVVRYAGGFLLHSGHPNPGLRTARKRYHTSWLHMGPPIIPHLISDHIDELEAMILELETEASIAGIEIGIQEADFDLITQIARLAKQTELPAIVRLPLVASADAFRQAALAGAPVLSFGPPRGGALFTESNPASGRLYGPSLFPLALEKLKEIRARVEVPIIAAGGIVNPRQVQAMLDGGASAVQLDSVLWTQPEALIQSDVLD
jgi:dihydroorotate dehydrogenase